MPFASCYEPAPATAPPPTAAAAGQPHQQQQQNCIMRAVEGQLDPQIDISMLHQAGFKTRQSASCIPVSTASPNSNPTASVCRAAEQRDLLMSPAGPDPDHPNPASPLGHHAGNLKRPRTQPRQPSLPAAVCVACYCCLFELMLLGVNTGVCVRAAAAAAARPHCSATQLMLRQSRASPVQ
jgi:hypothetical protein